jgi:TPR repeat protein
VLSTVLVALLYVDRVRLASVILMAALSCGRNADSTTALRVTCAGGNGCSCVTLGQQLEKDHDLSRAETFYRRGCELKQAAGCAGIAELLISRNAEGLSWLEKACTLDASLGSCDRLGAIYENGEHGAVKDTRRARRWYQSGCDRGDDLSCGDLGALTAQTNPKGGAEILQRVCEGKRVAGCGTLAFLYEKGYGVAEDEARALALYRKACGGGITSSCADACRLGDANSCH